MRPEFKLTVRGPATAEYRASLEKLIMALGLADRIELAPPVPMIDLVREAARFDVGISMLPGHSRNNQFALPNKLFEYTMAGLALCISDLPEVADILRKYKLGVTMAAMEPDAITAAINTLDRARIDQFKENALAAARELNWESEGAHFLSAAEAGLEATNHHNQRASADLKD